METGFYGRVIEFKRPDESLHAFTKHIGIPQSTQLGWKAGASPTRLRIDWGLAVANKIANVIGVNPWWLLLNTGPKYYAKQLAMW
jgi:hypothetical protein